MGPEFVTGAELAAGAGAAAARRGRAAARKLAENCILTRIVQTSSDDYTQRRVDERKLGAEDAEEKQCELRLMT